MFFKRRVTEAAKLRSIRTLLNAYDKGNIDREHMEAGLIHLFLPNMSKAIYKTIPGGKVKP